MIRKPLTVIFAIAFACLAAAPTVRPTLAEDALPSKSDASCLKCHSYDKEANVLAGKLVDVSWKAKAFQVQINKDMEVIYYDDSTVLKNAEEFKSIPKQESLKVTYFNKGGKNFAKEVEVKKGIEVPSDQKISEEEVAKLVAMGPEKGKYILLDSRPGNLYNQGHIPTAVSMPFFSFDTMAETVLPKDMQITQIYYCAGESCVLSPLAAKKAEKLGYKNLKVFRAGLPAWKKVGHLVVSTSAGLEDYQKADASYILLDLRPKSLVEKGYIPGAVALADRKIDALEQQFPKYKNAVVILYNEDGNLEGARDAYKKIAGWGYKQVSVLAGGFQGWKKDGKKIATGPAEQQIKYVRKTSPDEVEISVFRALLEKPGKDSVIIDVRTAKEFAEAALPSAISVPLDDLEQRLSDIPKDKTVLIHCGTGARAEMAYNVLKKAGFKVKYLKAKVEFDKDTKGKYIIEE